MDNVAISTTVTTTNNNNSNCCVSPFSLSPVWPLLPNQLFSLYHFVFPLIYYQLETL